MSTEVGIHSEKIQNHKTHSKAHPEKQNISNCHQDLYV